MRGGGGVVRWVKGRGHEMGRGGGHEMGRGEGP